MINNDIWIIGAGGMATEYSKVLKALNVNFITIGRSKENCDIYFESTGLSAIQGGIKPFMETNPVATEAAIVSVGIEALAETTVQLLEFGVKYILLEKPGIGYVEEIYDLCRLAKQKNATILLAYNRRFYASVQKAKALIQADGGVSSFQFEFTEWSHKIGSLQKSAAEHNNWFLGNSTHVIDTAFFLGGKPSEMSSYASGGLDWHPASSIFSGAGISEDGALFSYNANWEAPGRWVIEMLTKKHRFIFKPLETLQVQEIGSVSVNPVEIDDSLDTRFKPGLYLQTKAFLEKNCTNFCTIFEQKEMIDNFYIKMAGYVKRKKA